LIIIDNNASKRRIAERNLRSAIKQFKTIKFGKPGTVGKAAALPGRADCGCEM